MYNIKILILLGFFILGCSTTTYLSLKENDKVSIIRELNEYDKDKNFGAEIKIVLLNGKEIEGELLSVRDSSLIVCTEYSVTEGELKNSTFPVILIKNDMISELIFDGSSYIWIGIGAGYLAGSIIGVQIAKSSNESAGVWLIVGLGGMLGSAVGGIAGYAMSKEEYVLNEIPPDYDFTYLRNFSRYQEKEPEFIKMLVKE